MNRQAAPRLFGWHSRSRRQSSQIAAAIYRHVEGIGDDGSVTFIDKTGRGDFHLSPGNVSTHP